MFRICPDLNTTELSSFELANLIRAPKYTLTKLLPKRALPDLAATKQFVLKVPQTMQLWKGLKVLCRMRKCQVSNTTERKTYKPTDGHKQAVAN
jgi:hypothetical protein